ncbi:MAG: bacterial transcriptional activator domain-containing protein, partial [Patescibacteria group bacterium]
EEVYRTLMRLFALTDDRAAALRTFHSCATLLRQELDVAPSPATQRSTITGCVFVPIRYQTHVDPNCAKARTSISTATMIVLTKYNFFIVLFLCYSWLEL